MDPRGLLLSHSKLFPLTLSVLCQFCGKIKGVSYTVAVISGIACWIDDDRGCLEFLQCPHAKLGTC